MTTHDYELQRVQVEDAIDTIADSLSAWPPFEAAVVKQLGDKFPGASGELLDTFWSDEPVALGGRDDEGELIMQSAKTLHIPLGGDTVDVHYFTDGNSDDGLTSLRIRRSPANTDGDESIELLDSSFAVSLTTGSIPLISCTERGSGAISIETTSSPEEAVVDYVAGLVRGVTEQPVIQ